MYLNWCTRMNSNYNVIMTLKGKFWYMFVHEVLCYVLFMHDCSAYYCTVLYGVLKFQMIWSTAWQHNSSQYCTQREYRTAHKWWNTIRWYCALWKAYLSWFYHAVRNKNELRTNMCPSSSKLMWDMHASLFFFFLLWNRTWYQGGMNPFWVELHCVHPMPWKVFGINLHL